LIAKEDSISAFELAADSKAIAVATANDGFSMKAIAMMTMAFLPATFLVTVFAMPILHWDESDVMGPGMWIYVAISLSVTAVIFIVWLYMTRRQTQKSKNEDKTRRARLQREIQRFRLAHRPTALNDGQGVGDGNTRRLRGSHHFQMRKARQR
jgi:uncharacterized membrane protein